MFIKLSCLGGGLRLGGPFVTFLFEHFYPGGLSYGFLAALSFRFSCSCRAQHVTGGSIPPCLFLLFASTTCQLFFPLLSSIGL